jgi:hypothetical protein
MNGAPPPRPFSPFLRLLIGGAATALAAEWLRFQADVAWAALPAGAGAVATLASVARGMRARRAWRTAVAAERTTAQADPQADGPLPRGAGPSPLDAAPEAVVLRRADADAAPARPSPPLLDERDLAPAPPAHADAADVAPAAVSSSPPTPASARRGDAPTPTARRSRS